MNFVKGIAFEQYKQVHLFQITPKWLQALALNGTNAYKCDKHFKKQQTDRKSL